MSQTNGERQKITPEWKKYRVFPSAANHRQAQELSSCGVGKEGKQTHMEGGRSIWDLREHACYCIYPIQTNLISVDQPEHTVHMSSLTCFLKMYCDKSYRAHYQKGKRKKISKRLCESSDIGYIMLNGRPAYKLKW